ncbi:MAG: heavy-metal-associated domain-containing protein [Burkholderiales bacterium]|nr:heavy-metal-associated domain-containing protein [Nitrosomonas sp.]MCP5273681.1 heavy-metal-associated domain-containing protein [Burkholderiales bacterium]
MQTTTINIQGMTCQGCVSSIKTVLEKLPGISQVEVSLDQSLATIHHNPSVVGIEQIKAAISDAGFEVID